MKKFYVYLITNNILNKQYIGSRICYKENLNEDNYWGSSKYLKEDIKIYGIENFTKEILKDDYENAKDMLNDESILMHKYDVFEPNGYNRYDPILRKFYSYGCKLSEEHKIKISKSQLGKKKKPCSKETKLKIGKANKGKQPWLGRKHRPESIKKIKDRLDIKGIKNPFYGKHHSEQTRINLSQQTLNVEKQTCSKCGKKFAPGMLKRWHNENCRH